MLRQPVSALANFDLTLEFSSPQIPKQLHGVAGKYATSLYVIAAKRNLLEPVEQELRQVVEAARASPSFLEFMKDPSVPYEKRVKAVVELFEKSEFSDITKNFLALLAEYGRLKEIFKVLDSYHELVLAHKGEVKAVVTSALEMSESELDELKNVLKGWLKAGQVLHVEQKVDRSIIGGFVVDLEDKHIDLSIQSKIRQVEAALLTNA